MSLYLAVWSDLSPEQVRRVADHVDSCPHCAQEQQALDRVTQLMARTEPSSPSVRVDQAVMEAIAARRSHQVRQSQASIVGERSRKMPRGAMLSAMVAALVLLVIGAITGSTYFIFNNVQQQAFVLPADLSWDKYVLFHKQTRLDVSGEQYEVMSYHNMSARMMNVEMVMAGKIDVVVVKDTQKSLGLDMMHHVAQWDVNSGGMDDMAFDLQRLRADLRSGHATYLGKDHFKGQEVYRIRCANGEILLLDMQYMPINVLEQNPRTHTHQPMYDTVQWLAPNKVLSSMWDMQVPHGFQMGAVPMKP